MNIKRALKVRLYPTPEQTMLIKQTAGCKRLVYNYFLAHKNNFYEENIKDKDLTDKKKKEIYGSYKPPRLVDLKKEFTFLNNVSYKALEQAIQDLFKAFKNFFQGRAENLSSKRRKIITINSEKIRFQLISSTGMIG